jgi:hypothetical protein
VSIINPPVGNSSYHAGFVKLERRFSHGLSLLAHYTFSKFLDDAASANEFGDPGSYMDAYNRRLDKGLSGSDIPHRAVITLLYSAPAVSKSRVVRAATGGWQLGLLTVLQSGAPFTVFDSVNQSNSFSAGTMRPDRIADIAVADPTLAGVEECRSDPGAKFQGDGAVAHRAARGVLQRHQSCQLRPARTYLGERGFRRDLVGGSGAHGATGATAAVLA